MLYEFTIENYRSFGATQTLSLMRSKGQRNPENLFEPVAGFPMVVRAAAIFGHNASGKKQFLAGVSGFHSNNTVLRDRLCTAGADSRN